MLHDGVVHGFGHGQQARLSVAHVEALREGEGGAVVRTLPSQGRKEGREVPLSSHTWMCSSRGTGLTLGWKLNVAVVLQPSQWATSLALDREELRATMRMGRSICEEMYLILEQMTSNTG